MTVTEPQTAAKMSPETLKPSNSERPTNQKTGITSIQENPLVVNPGDDVLILGIGRVGKIKGIYVSRDYIQYEIRWAVKGELKTDWFGASEIELPTKSK